MLKQIKVAITMVDGSLQIMSFLTAGRGNLLPIGAEWISELNGYWRREPTEATIAVEVRKTFEGHDEQPMSWRIVPESSVPIDRSYRGAWEDKAGAIVHNVDKAKNIHRDRLRIARVEKFAELDAAYIRADENNDQDEKKKIVAQKKFLRDVPASPEIENAKTINELKSFWPPELE